jgi:hypothetical protein
VIPQREYPQITQIFAQRISADYTDYAENYIRRLHRLGSVTLDSVKLVKTAQMNHPRNAQRMGSASSSNRGFTKSNWVGVGTALHSSLRACARGGLRMRLIPAVPLLFFGLAASAMG